MSSLAIELYNCLDQEINDSDREAERRLVVTGLHHNISWDWKGKRQILENLDIEKHLMFCFDCREVRERQRGLINNLYDDMESHNSKAVSEIYLSTGYFQSLLPMGNGT